MPDSNFLISFIIPTFNRPEFLEQTLVSLLHNTDNRWEAVCVDDGSDEETINILEKYAGSYDQIKFIQRETPPKGAPHCRNIGVKHAKGEFLVFLDSDDLAAPWYIADQLKLTEQFPEYDLWAYSMLIFKNKPGDEDILWEKDFLNTKDYLEVILSIDNPWSGSALVWRRKTFESFGKWNEQLVCWQDWELHLRVILQNLKVKENYDLRPQIFIRRNNVSQITNEKTFQKTLLSRKNMFLHSFKLLKENKRTTEKNILALSGYVFRDALRIIDNRLNTSWKEFYNVLKEFNISRFTYCRGYLFLMWRAFTKNSIIENKLTCHEWPLWVPSWFSSKRKYKLQKVKPEFLEQVKQLKF